MRDAGLFAQLRNPPGGRDARIMLNAQFLDRTGTGVWNAAAVLYFTVEAGLDARRIGLLLGLGGMAGILSSTRFAVLLPAIALTVFGDRAAKTLEMLFATEVAGPERATYQALSRSTANAGIAIGAGIAAIGPAIGTHDAYRALILLDALSFAAISLLVRRIRRTTRARPPAEAAEPTRGTRNPWKDRGYLSFVFLDIFMMTDDSVLNVGLPLWLLTRTSAPHALVPAFLVVNTVLVVLLQMRISAATKGPRDATTAVARYGVLMFACCVCLAAAPGFGTWLASLTLLLAAGIQTFAELMRSVSSWELAIALAPEDARPAYLGSVLQRHSCLRKLDDRPAERSLPAIA